MATTGKPMVKRKVVGVYVPDGDLSVITQIECLIRARRASGYRSSFSFEAVRLWKLGLKSQKGEANA